ncbi:UDP-N-acetylmuramoyl-L-alanyl-D-glutamate--2,6-diaminopimelate ligase [Kytococcus schroeteri]|uniref:UDP-N-acetylmuramyl-tripeptide synthetase n=1 Tax=Kytococcus schroeteri TaxID=138300 RepID=A0A2I1P8Y2_9MICO|nr:UDP-N-acetylmuramoyl-L-alanyl-D-glutamate--2,6-diaminopimelate ligase [Kytococcus schroeteri]PKZ41087.1 UDP-N-acetylmuramoyl-L-alanyl-D-glutamate--2,6-diaminopimelate ligase [Kytococcus schroeteri]
MLTRDDIATALALPVREVPEEFSGTPGITAVTHDSRAVTPGAAFVAVSGFKNDGLRFAPGALDAGAGLVVVEREWPTAADREADPRIAELEAAGPLPVVRVRDARAALGHLAAAVNGNPSRSLRVHGITGTNGKTTTSYVLYNLLAGVLGTDKVGLSTTVEVIVDGVGRPAMRTTPEAPLVQENLRRMVEAGASDAVLETSSHGLELHRVTGVEYASAIFTNLTRDHLDIHGDMETYFQVKRQLFERTSGPRLANVDDTYGRRLAREFPGALTFGFDEAADYRIVEPTDLTLEGMQFTLDTPRHGELRLEPPLVGDYNALNVAGAVAVALESGHDSLAVVEAVKHLGQVPGRFQRIPEAAEHGFMAVVDYAHTEVGLEVVLTVARKIADMAGGRLICVYGAAGERDAAKRPLMGEVVSRIADVGIITTDDPYGEDPATIAEEVMAGADAGDTHITLDRRTALLEAVAMARENDLVIACGKGDEAFQHLPSGDVDHHDPTSIREGLARR